MAAAESFGGGGKDGGVILADNTQFPGVVGNGLSWLAGFLGVSQDLCSGLFLTP